MMTGWRLKNQVAGQRQSLGGFLQLIGRKLGTGIVCLCLLLLFLFAVGTLDTNECIQERRQLKTTGPCLASAGEPTCFASFRTRSRHVGPPAEKLCGWWQGTNAVERWSDGAMDRNGGDGAWTGLQLAHLIGGSLCNPLLGAGRAARCPVLQDRDADGSIWGTAGVTITGRFPSWRSFCFPRTTSPIPSASDEAWSAAASLRRTLWKRGKKILDVLPALFLVVSFPCFSVLRRS